MPDINGLNTYNSWLNNGRSQTDILYAILSSEEFSKKNRHWRIVHEELRKILGNDFYLFKNYQAIIEYVSNGQKLPAKQTEINKTKSSKFVLVDIFLIHFSSVINSVGFIVDVIDNRLGLPCTQLDNNDLRFFINNVNVQPVKYGSQFLLPTTSKSDLVIEIQYKKRSYYNELASNLNDMDSFGKISVALVGRFENITSIGALTLTFLHHLHENFSCKLIDTRPEDSRWGSIDKSFSTLKEKESEVTGIDVAIYTDVFSNAISDENYKKVPPARIKIAYVVFDSTRIPSWWVESLNTTFDAIITTSKWGKKIIESSGVLLPVFYVPLSLDLSLYNNRKILRNESRRKFRFGSVASFTYRKNILQLIHCFIDCFGDSSFSDSVELLIHAPLNFGGAYKKEVLDLIKERGAKNIIISSEELNEYNYASLMNSFDIYVLISKGECYSITPRQALTLGKPTILSAGHAHDEMIESGLFLPIKVAGYEPTYFEAFGGQAIGLQCYYNNADVSNALRTAYFKYTEVSANSNEKVAYGNSFSHENLKYFYTNIIAPKNVFLGSENKVVNEGIIVNSKDLYRKYCDISTYQRDFTLSTNKFLKIIVPVHDGGFFSVFNTFLSHFVWNFNRAGVSAVIPDWRISTLKSYRSIQTPMSFCYGTEADGNIFIRLFLPIPDMPVHVSDYNNDSFLKSNSTYLDDFNEKNEPLLTYIHARKLYKSADFAEWRHRYGRFYSKYFKVNDSIKTRIDAIVLNKFDSNYVIGVHIKHPSHVIEQANGFMPNVSDFIKKILDIIEIKKLVSYKIFLATDQESVVESLKLVFGERLIFRDGVVRTTSDDDARYLTLDKVDQMREGHQIQNLIASDQSRWSIKMAEDVLIDAHLLASCNLFLHVTSNIATAVSYINPEIEMIYCE